jgi:transcriptional regulator with XRE-family HTH domain
MSAENELLDLVRDAGKFNSDNALAQRLGVTRAMVSSWRSGRYVMPDERIAQLCALAKLDGPSWMAKIHAERAQTPAEKALWKTALDRLSAVAAVAALVTIAAPTLHSGNHAGLVANSTAYSVATSHSLYIM